MLCVDFGAVLWRLNTTNTTNSGLRTGRGVETLWVWNSTFHKGKASNYWDVFVFSVEMSWPAFFCVNTESAPISAALWTARSALEPHISLIVKYYCSYQRLLPHSRLHKPCVSSPPAKNQQNTCSVWQEEKNEQLTAKARNSSCEMTDIGIIWRTTSTPKIFTEHFLNCCFSTTGGAWSSHCCLIPLKP